MAKVFQSGFKRRTPDPLTEELVTLLSGKASFEFKPLFDLILRNLNARNLVHGSEEMLRLRAYEKLQLLVAQGAVKKTIKNEVKKYKGLDSLAGVLVVAPNPVYK